MPWPIKHGMVKSKEYRAWVEAKRRCLNINSKDYKRYGAKGVKIDSEFIDSFEAFYNEVGKAPSPKHSLDRIDGQKGYIKGNLKWSTSKQQAYNRNTSYIVTINGKQYDGFSEAGRALGVTKVTIGRRCRGHYDKRFGCFTKPWEGYSCELRYR